MSDVTGILSQIEQGEPFMRTSVGSLLLLGGVLLAQEPATQEGSKDPRSMKVLVNGKYREAILSPITVQLNDLAFFQPKRGNDSKGLADRAEKDLRDKYAGKLVRVDKVTLDSILPGGKGSFATYKGLATRVSSTTFGKPEEVYVTIGTDVDHLAADQEPVKGPKPPGTPPEEDLIARLAMIERLTKELRKVEVNVEGIGEIKRTGDKVVLIIREAVVSKWP